MYDVIIIGGGPAALNAYLYAARKKLKLALITDDFGGQINWSSSVENYLGFPQISGVELVEIFLKHIKEYEGDIINSEKVIELTKKGNFFEIKTNKDKIYNSKTVIVASGRKPRKLGVPGEEEFIGKGIAFCATCDAPIFLDQDVLVVGGGNSAFDAALQLANYAKQIYLVDVAPKFFADPIMIQKAKNTNKVEFFQNTKVKEIKGDNFVNEVILEDLETKKEFSLKVTGVFIEIGSVPNHDFIKEPIEVNQADEIVIKPDTSTNIEGLFACGDVTNVYGKQVIIAAAEGAKSALAVYDYLTKTNNGE